MEVWSDLHLAVWGLFVSSFVSATLAPGGSEIILVYLLSQGEEPAWLLWVVATTGNTLGGISSFIIGYLISKGYWPPEKVFADKNHKLLAYVRRWGVSTLLLSWLPAVGDVFCVLAGWLRLSFIVSSIAMFVGKGMRYAVVIYLQILAGYT